MNDQHDDKAFLETVNKKLDQRVDELDESTRSALKNIRCRAVAKSTLGDCRRWWWQPEPMFALASTVLIVGVLVTANMDSSLDDVPDLQDMAMIMATDDIELYQDLEFYQWLEAQNING